MDNCGAVMSEELLQYAANIYRRFPEEFLALGRPGLESTFDLRQLHRARETTQERTIEVTMRRWPSPVAPSRGWPVGAGLHGLQPQHYGLARQTMALAGSISGYGCGNPRATAFAFGAPPAAAFGAPPTAVFGVPSVAASAAVGSAVGAATEERVTARLLRLEEALAALKPQVEMIVHQQAAALAAGAPTSAAVMIPAVPAATAAAAVPTTAQACRGATASAYGGPSALPQPQPLAQQTSATNHPLANISPATSPLRVRRQVPQLAVVAPKKPTKGPASPVSMGGQGGGGSDEYS